MQPLEQRCNTGCIRTSRLFNILMELFDFFIVRVKFDSTLKEWNNIILISEGGIRNWLTVSIMALTLVELIFRTFRQVLFAKGIKLTGNELEVAPREGTRNCVMVHVQKGHLTLLLSQHKEHLRKKKKGLSSNAFWNRRAKKKYRFAMMIVVKTILTVSSSSVTLAKKYHQAPLESCKKSLLCKPFLEINYCANIQLTALEKSGVRVAEHALWNKCEKALSWKGCNRICDFSEFLPTVK